MENYFIASVCLTDQIGCVRAKHLLNYFGSGKAIWSAPRDALEKTNLQKNIINLFTHFRRLHPHCPEQLKEYCEKRKIKLCSIYDSNYPEILKSLPDAPVLLYYKGELRPNDPRIAIVGTRHPTKLGLKTAQQFGEEIARTGITVVSGAAFGIDMAAHEGAMKTGRTVAILGEGLEAVMSYEKRKFLERVIENGAVITEYSPNTPATKGTFPQRNRIIAGLSVGVVVVEAGEGSGAMNTAQHAANYGKLTFAVPGSIYEEKSKGCHELIRDGVILARSAADVIEDCKFNIDFDSLNPYLSLNFHDDAVPSNSTSTPKSIIKPIAQLKPKTESITLPNLEGAEEAIFNIIPTSKSISTEEISARLDTLELSDIMSTLLNLEMKDLINEESPGNYIRS
ncbi:MAG: DNA-processing protein DprA [Selenomonadaceae bacterium]|nr:DNA-processing protein DprA [Selenomonadaceae bacterium]